MEGVTEGHGAYTFRLVIEEFIESGIRVVTGVSALRRWGRLVSALRRFY